MDTAELTIVNNVLESSLYTISNLCYKCPLRHVINLYPARNATIDVQTNHETHLEIRQSKPFSSVVCRTSFQFQQNYKYKLEVNRSANESCNVQVLHTALDYNIPVYTALACIVLLIIFRLLILFVKSRCGRVRTAPSSLLANTHILSSSDNVTLVTTMKPARLKSLDTFRGLCLCVMIFVNYGGGGYSYFSHSVWNGLTVADTVFPWFVFIMGSSLGLSMNSLIQRAIPKRFILLKIIRRTITLIILGIMISNMGSKELVGFKNFRVCGVLQRLAVTYFIVSLVHLSTIKCSSQAIQSGYLRDILPFWSEWLIVLSLLCVHCAVTFGVKFENCPRGYLGAGGTENNSSNFNCTGGAAGWLDRIVLGHDHVYQRVTSMKVYLSTTPYDPEGLLGTLTSVLICFLGLQAGKIIVLYKNYAQRISRFIIWAVICGGIAALLCKCQINGGWIPINKNLWSVSYVLCLSSMAFLLLAVFYTIIDHLNLWHGFPFYTSGMNSIALYLGHELLARVFPVQFSVTKRHPYLLCLHLYGVVLWVVVASLLHRNHLYITI